MITMMIMVIRMMRNDHDEDSCDGDDYDGDENDDDDNDDRYDDAESY